MAYNIIELKLLSYACDGMEKEIPPLLQGHLQVQVLIVAIQLKWHPRLKSRLIVRLGFTVKYWESTCGVSS